MTQTLDGFVSKWHRAPVTPAIRRYTFAVYLEAPEAVDEDDVDGYTREDVEALVKRLLSSYATRREAREVQTLGIDWELMDSELVTPEPPAPRARLTQQERLEGLADRGIDTHDDYNETK